jgi:hypothetical protein
LQQGFLTGGSDKKIQFWNFELKDENENHSKKVDHEEINLKYSNFNLDEKTFII